MPLPALAAAALWNAARAGAVAAGKWAIKKAPELARKYGPQAIKLGKKAAKKAAELGKKGWKKLKDKFSKDKSGGCQACGKQIARKTYRTTRDGKKAVRVEYKDGTVKDISPDRVKVYKPNTHPNAPPGSLQKVKFPDSLPGSKGFKRLPTQEELGLLK